MTEIAIVLCGIRIRGEITAPPGMLVMFQEKRKTARIFAIPAHGVDPEPPKVPVPA